MYKFELAVRFASSFYTVTIKGEAIDLSKVKNKVVICDGTEIQVSGHIREVTQFGEGDPQTLYRNTRI